jgi:tRNA dimethylallyltransferase
MTTPALVIAGPTAVGKTALAVQVAERRGGEIVGTDSMQAYQGMVIGTAAPTQQDLRGIPHHMLHVWPIQRAVTVMEFQAAARAAIRDVELRGHLPIVVGGSGLYVRAVMDELHFPPTDATVRANVEQQLAELGPQALHHRLAAVDPDAAAAIEPGNGRRIVRALEVNAITGEHFRARLPEPVSVMPSVRVGLLIDRADLDARIRARVNQMWADGFVDEVIRLRAVGLAAAPTASRALGYQQILAMLAGEVTEEQAREATIEATRRFARRQQRWFRRDTRITWIAYDRIDLVDHVVALLEGTAT